jgi:hypothetical protein
MAVSLLLGGALSPSVARAGCGDHVLLPGQAPAQAAVPTGPVSPLPGPAAPCTGPNCSRPLPLPLAPVAPVEQAVEPWACLPPALAGSRGPGPSALALDRASDLPPPLSGRLFRPPRPLAS